MRSDDLCHLSVHELSRLIKQRALSPVDIVDALLARIEALDGTLRAYAYVDADGARAAARVAEVEIGRGQYRGPLHGIPVAHKDMFDVQGLPTTCGSWALRGYVASTDCAVAAKLRGAGAICLGKLNTTEFGPGGTDRLGAARNPWDLAASSGGSSSGSAVALAGGMVHLATGGDTGGSIRIPAALCGIVGLRPTAGLVSRVGAFPISPSLDQIGPMARCAGDAALLLQTLGGHDPRDPSSAPAVLPESPAVHDRRLTGVRVGVPHGFFLEETTPEIAGALQAAITVLQSLGADVRAVELPHARYGRAAFWAIAFPETFTIHRAHFTERASAYTPAFIRTISGAACLTAEERVIAQRVRDRITAEFHAALAQADVIITPVTPYAADRLDDAFGQPDIGVFTRPISLTGLPALAVPCGFTDAGLPIGAQLVGRAWEEDLLLRVGQAYERATRWHERRPTLRATRQGDAVPQADAPSQVTARDAVDAPWVRDCTRRMGLTYLREEDIPHIARSIGPVKADLAAAREALRRHEPATRWLGQI